LSINEWSRDFIRIFRQFSSSELKLPKLHSWIYHIIDSIRNFGSINGYTAETYESLHCEYVKVPYRLSNKKDIENQLMQIVSVLIFINVQYYVNFSKFLSLQVRRQSIAKLASPTTLSTTSRAFNFSSKLFEFSLTEAFSFLERSKADPNLNDKIKTGFNHFLTCMDSYLDLINISIDDIQTKITIFGSVTLENGAIIRANSNYHKKPWFSNIAIVMDSEEFFDYMSDKGICYGQVIILFYFIIIYDIY
jgi:hypothetical protein